MSHVNKFISFFASIQSNATQVCGCHPQSDPTGWRLCQWGGTCCSILPFMMINCSFSCLVQPILSFQSMHIWQDELFAISVAPWFTVDHLNISNQPCFSHLEHRSSLISYQVWYRVIQIVINRDDVQVHFRNVHVLWYEYKVKFVPDMWLGCFHSHRKFTHQK